LSAQTQHALVEAQRQIEFAAIHVMAGLSVGYFEEFRGRAQLLPQLSCACINLARFRCGLAFDDVQHRAQGNAQFKLLSLPIGGVGQ